MKTVENGFYSCGVWPMASYINHSCYGNAYRAFIGDMMIVRATRDLPPDTEILFWYDPPTAHGNYDRLRRLKQWSFECDCAICRDDQATSKKTLNSRKQQRAEVLRYLDGGKANIPR